MLAIYNNPKAQLKDLAKYLKAKGWVTGDPNIYGGGARIGIFDSLAKLGLATKSDKGYNLTLKGQAWVDSSLLMKNAQNAGSDLHIQLMKKTIEKLHEDNTLVIVPEQQEAPDLITYPMAKGKKKYLWDDKRKRAYEIQTTARKENVLANRERNKKQGLETTWVIYYKEGIEELRKLTNNEDEYLLIRMDK